MHLFSASADDDDALTTIGVFLCAGIRYIDGLDRAAGAREGDALELVFAITLKPDPVTFKSVTVTLSPFARIPLKTTQSSSTPGSETTCR
jgi:hypothetical protein